MNNLTIESKLPRVGTTIFTVMSALAQEVGAINLSQGFPDFDMPSPLVGFTIDALRQGYNQYAPMAGWLPLRQAIADKINRLYGAKANPETEITITPGATYAIYTALTTILKPNDEVIVFEPAYDSYIPNIEINGAVAVRIPLSFPDYRIDWKRVRGLCNARTKVIIINNPHNPTGSTLSENDIVELRKLVKKYNLFIIADEVYEHLVYDDQPHRSILRYKDLRARAFACYSFGKVYDCTGWKIGYCVAPEGFMNEFRKVHQFNCFSCHTPSQVALAQFVADPSSYEPVAKFYEDKRNYFTGLMSETRFKPLPSDGSFFQLYRYNHFSDLPDKDFSVWLTRTHKVACIPVSVFYQDGTDNGVVRFCFAKKDSTLERAAALLKKL